MQQIIGAIIPNQSKGAKGEKERHCLLKKYCLTIQKQVSVFDQDI